MLKKIYYIGSFQLPDKNASANRVVAISELLVQRGNEVTIWSSARQVAETNRDIEKFEKHCDTKLSLMSGKFRVLIKKVFDDINRGKDVCLICYNLRSDMLFCLIILSKFIPLLIVADITEWYTPSFSNLAKNIVKWADVKIRMLILNRMIKTKIVVSPFLLQFYTSQNHKKKIVRIPTLLPKGDGAKVSIPVVDNKKGLILFYAGDPFRYTGHPVNKKAMKERIDLIVEFVAKSNIEEIAVLKIFGITLQQYITSFPNHIDIIRANPNRIIFGGKVSRAKVSEELQKSDFMLILREKNITNEAGFPTKFTEAMKNGTPVITTNSTDISDFFIEGSHGYYVEIYKEQIIGLNSIIKISTPEKIMEMRKKCLYNKILDNESFLGHLDVILD